MSLKMMLQTLQNSLIKNTAMLMYPVFIKKGRNYERKNKKCKKVLLHNTQALLKKSGFRKMRLKRFAQISMEKRQKEVLVVRNL